MQQLTLFSQIQGPELERAQSLELFADPDRLARKPRCADDKDFSVVRSQAHALAHRYIQPSTPVVYPRLVFDLDWHKQEGGGSALWPLSIKSVAESNAWIELLNVPEPSWCAISPGKNSAHVCYELCTPVGRHQNARMAPQRLLAAVEAGLCEKLSADPGYAGGLCKNPINSAWQIVQGGPRDGYELNELAEYVSLARGPKPRKYNREPRGEVGRNVYLFDEVRFWAYDNVDHYRGAGSGFEAWQSAVLGHAERFAAAGFAHLPINQDFLPYGEIKSIARSVARWTWANCGKSSLTAAFSELQAWRGARAARVKRERTEDAIRNAQAQLLAEGALPTLRAVARRIGKDPGGLSRHYKHLFEQSAQ